MKNKPNHIIQCQSIDIEFEDPAEAMGLQNLIAEVFYEKLQPRMEVLFDELFGENYFASVDKLEIDCGVLSKKNWEQEFTDQAIRQIRTALARADKKEIDVEKDAETNAIETFFFFLENGFLPWNKRFDSIAELEQLLKINGQLISKIKKLILHQGKAAERLAWQFSEKFTSKIIDLITSSRQDELAGLYLLLEKANPSGNYQNIDTHLIDAAILTVFASDDPAGCQQQFFTFMNGHTGVEPALKTAIENALKNSVIQHRRTTLSDGEREGEPSQATENEREESFSAKKSKKEELNDPVYIKNAGLILLHPFLPNLFEQLVLTRENSWTDKDSQHLAILASSFITTGKEHAEEFNLVLNKILCGVATEEVVTTQRQLTPGIKNECDALLMEVISHWNVLKNTSVEGLRDTFLQRNGKLSKVDHGWLLQVEQKPVDILLGHLPWGISTLKLPWMNEILFVDW